MNENKVRNTFNPIAENYDSQRRDLIPCFDEFYKTVATLSKLNPAATKILDVGAGTGLLSNYLVEHFPEAEFTLIDLSEQMLEIAQERFMALPNVKYITANYFDYQYTEKYDIIISSLSIHHLTHEQKAELCKRFYNTLNTKGLFINADLLKSPSERIENFNQNLWLNYIHNSDLPISEIQAAVQRMNIDLPALLTDNLQWLAEAGFQTTDIAYKFRNFGVWFGQK